MSHLHIDLRTDAEFIMIADAVRVFITLPHGKGERVVERWLDFDQLCRLVDIMRPVRDAARPMKEHAWHHVVSEAEPYPCPDCPAESRVASFIATIVEAAAEVPAEPEKRRRLPNVPLKRFAALDLGDDS